MPPQVCKYSSQKQKALHSLCCLEFSHWIDHGGKHIFFLFFFFLLKLQLLCGIRVLRAMLLGSAIVDDLYKCAYITAATASITWISDAHLHPHPYAQRTFLLSTTNRLLFFTFPKQNSFRISLCLKSILFKFKLQFERLF